MSHPVTTAEKEPYAYYFARLEGEDVQPEARAPEAGFYRRRSNAFPGWIPVAIWPNENGNLIAMEIPPTGGAPVAAFDLEEIITVFGMCWNNPVPEDVWRAVVERGEPWPDDPPEPKPQSNLSADPLEEVLYQLRGEEEELQLFLREPIDSEEKADRAAHWKARVEELGKKADELRKAEKRPHDEAAKRVQERWRPACELADTLKRQIASALTPYLRERERRLAEERQRAAESGAAIPRAKNAKAGKLNTVALVTLKKGVVEDQKAFATYLIDQSNADLRDCLQQIANKLARAGAMAPGMRIVEDQKAR